MKRVLLPVLACSVSSFATTHLCYVPGADGLDRDFTKELAEAFQDRPDVELHAFDVGSKGDVVQRSRRLQVQLQKLLEANPHFRCHLMGYSMGGVISCYLFAKINLSVKGKRFPWTQVIASLTTFVSPHRGTPVADLIGEFFPSLQGRGLESLSERAMQLVSDPSKAEYWTAPAVPTYSYRAYLLNRDEAYSFAYKFAHEFIEKDANRRGLDPRNDGLVPTRSEGFGQVLADLSVPHSYFTEKMEPYYDLDGFQLMRMQWDCLENGKSALFERFTRSDYFRASAGMTSFCRAK